MKSISKDLREALMSTCGFGQGVAAAVLSLTMPNGDKVVVDFEYVKTVDVSSNSPKFCDISDAYGFGYSTGLRDSFILQDTTLKISGKIRTTTTTAGTTKKEKPVPKPKAPTVKTSALRLRKADKAATVAAKKLAKLEAALQHAKVVKGLADTERKLATEALLGSAIA